MLASSLQVTHAAPRRTVTSAPGAGKKLHQRKRKSAEKTKTLTLKKHPCVDALHSSDEFA